LENSQFERSNQFSCIGLRKHQVHIYLLKNSLAVKKGAALFKIASVKKSCEIKGMTKKWL